MTTAPAPTCEVERRGGRHADLCRRAHVVTVAVVGLAGCGVHVPPAAPPIVALEIPSGWSTAAPAGDVAGAQWWQTLGSPALEPLLDEALEQNHDLRAAAARIETALADARVAGADLAPQVGASLVSSRTRQNLTNFPDLPGLGGGDGGPLSFMASSFGLSLNVNWEADLWGRLRAHTQAAIALAQAQEGDYLAARLSLAGQVAKIWFALTEARLQGELAEATVVSYRETTRQASARVAAGIQNPSDAHLADANLAQAEALLQQRRETVTTVSRQLEVLLGRYPRGTARGDGALPRLPDDLPAAGIPAAVVGRRPDLAAAERRLLATEAQLRASRRALYPSLSLSTQGGTTTGVVDRLLDGDFLVWSIGANLVQTVFQGGRLRAQVASAEGRQRDVFESFASLALGAFAEVETTLATEVHLRERERHLTRATASALEAVRIAESRYGQGVDPLLVVLEAQRRALDAESALIQVRRRLLENRIDLHLALGGDIR